MKLSTIFLIALVILLVMVIVQFMSSSKTDLTKVINDASLPVTIAASDLPSASNGSNYAYSLWFYINDWNARYGEPKIVFRRKDSEDHLTPQVSLGAYENNLKITMSVHGPHGHYPKDHCNVENIPLQNG